MDLTRHALAQRVTRVVMLPPFTTQASATTAFPQTVVGIQDSAGKLDTMAAMIARFSVLAGADPLLLPLMQIGGAGSIAATCPTPASNCPPSKA